MWNRVLGLSNEKRENTSSSSGRRKGDDEKRPERKRTTSTRKSTGTEEKDRGIDPISTSYSSSSRAQYSGVASGSVASSYATAQSNNTDETILPPPLVGSVMVASTMPKPRSEREEQGREYGHEQETRKKDRSTSRNRKEDRQNRSRSRDREERRRDRKERRERRQERGGPQDSGMKKAESDYQRTNRAGEAVDGSRNFSAQVGGSGFTQFPGQFDGGVPGFPSGRTNPPHMSDHIPDQFPGQFPTGSSAPYRPPLSIEDGGPGLAADYYGDAGESVATQPGVRPQAPTLIVGAQPHLMAASPVEAPPVEPSSTGGVGAAASFFSGATFESSSATPKHNQPPGRPTGVPPGAPSQPSYSNQPNSFALPVALAGTAALGYIASTHGEAPHGPAQGSTSNFAGSVSPQISVSPIPNTYPTASMPPTYNNHSSSAPIIPTLGSATIGATAGYMIGSHTLQQQPSHPPLPIQGSADYRLSHAQHPPQQMDTPQGSYPGYDRPSQSGKQSPSSSNIPIYAAGALGAVGLAAAAYHHEHHDSAQNSYITQTQAQPSAFMPQQHRHSGPLSKFVDFFRDPEGVAQFEEYSEYIGVCRYCFAPGSSPREAPRKHFYRRKRSNERLGASIRVDKESRYSSSEGESRRRNKNTSWIASGIAGMGLAKVGESLFASNHDFDDTYSVRSGRVNQSKASLNGRRYNNSPNRKSSISHGVVTDPSNVQFTNDQKQVSTYKDNETGIGEAALVAAMRAAAIGDSSSRKRSRSPRGTFTGSKPRSSERHYGYGSEQIRKDRTGHSPGSAYIEVTEGNDYNGKGRESMKKKKNKKKKAGFFNFANSSSSDTGLVANTGSDRSRAKKSSRTKIKDHNDANAALIGLGAATAALAAAEGRKSDKGKRRSGVVALKEVKVNDSRRFDERRVSLQKPTYSNMDEAQWESASEEVGYSSVDSALAYGLSRRRSNDSLHSDSSGTEKWGWRWGSGRRKKKDKLNHESHLTDTIVRATSGQAGAAVEASIFAKEDPRHTAGSSNSSLPPLQHVYPIATSDPSHYDVIRHDSVTSTNQPMRTSRPAAIPLQQPQPVLPVSSVIYASQAPYNHSYSAPAGPPVFSQPSQPSSFVPGHGMYNGYVDVRQGIVPVQHLSEHAVMAAVPQTVPSESKLRRRDSSPSPEIIYIEPKQPKRSSTRDDMSAVRFELTEEQRNKDFRNRERERNNSDMVARDEELHYVIEDVNTDGKPRRSKKGPRSSDKSRQDEQINSELNSFKQPENAPTKIRNGSAWVTPGLVGVAGAVIGAATTEWVPGVDDRRDARRSAKPDETEGPTAVEDHKKKQLSDVEDEGKISHDEHQKALAKKAAALVKRTPSPAHQDYSSFFAPTEFLSKSNKKTIVDDSNGGNDITSNPVPEIVTNEPTDQRGPLTSVPYTFSGADEEGDIDPNLMRLPWQVPKLNLIKPTPPASMAGSVRGDTSPILRPEDAHVSDNEEHEQSEKDSKRGKVTFGESETHEYEVVTPEDHRDEFIRDVSEDRTAEEEKSRGQAIPVASSQSTESPVEEITREHMPGDFGDDLDFAATLAAGLQGSGFDPAIVIDDPTYRRRDSPPGSEDRAFYRRPFSETVEDLSLDSTGTESDPPQRGFVEGEISPTPEDELTAESIRPAEDGRDNSEVLLTGAKTVEKANDDVKILPKENEFREPYHDSELPHIIEVVPRTVLDDYSGSPVDRSSYTNETLPGSTNDKDEFQDASEFASIDHRNRGLPDIRPAAGDALEAEVEFISTKKRTKKSKGRGKNQDQVIHGTPDDNLISNAATAPPPEEFEDQKESKKKSMRKTSEHNDEASVVSSPANFDSEKDVNDGLGNVSVASISSVMDVTNQSADQDMARKPNKAREATSDDYEEPKKKDKKSKLSKNKADEEWYKVEAPEMITEPFKVEEEKGSQSQKSGSKRDKRKKNGRRNGNEDSGMVTQGMPAEHGNLDKKEETVSPQYLDDHDANRGIPRSSELDQPLSFLGMRREVTEPPDINSTHDPGSTIRRVSSEETFRDAIRSKIIEQGLPALPASRPTSPTAVGSTGDLPSLPPSPTTSPVATPVGRRRRLSALQLAESNHGGSSPSPTAVPLMFRRFPSTGISRSNPSSPGQSPRTVAPFSPRQRQGRPLSTEFKSSTEFRPLWLVERHNPSRRGQGPEVAEEIYPSLPSSHSTSRASSVHDPDIEDSDETRGNDVFHKDIIVDQEVPFSFAHKSYHTEDFLDSQQPTPTRDSFFHELETRPIDPMQHLPNQSVHSSPREDGPNLELLEHGEYYPENLPPLPQSRDSSPDEETVSRGTVSTTRGVAIGAMATGALATILDSTSRSDGHHDLDQTRTGKREPDDRFQAPEAELSRSEPGLVVPGDEFEAFVTTKNKKKKDKKQRKIETVASGDKGVLEDISLFGNARLDRGLYDAHIENDLVREAAPVQSESSATWFSSTPSRKLKKDKKDKGKSNSRSIDTPNVDDLQPEKNPDVYVQAQQHESASSDSELKLKLDQKLPISGETTIEAVVVTAAVAAGAGLNAESSKIPSVATLPPENEDWPDFSTKLKKGKEQKWEITSGFSTEHLPAPPSSFEEVESLDSSTRDSVEVEEKDSLDIPLNKRSKKGKKNRKSSLTQELEENLTSEANQSKAAVVPKDIEIPRSLSEIPENVDREIMPGPGTIDSKLGVAEPVQIEMVSPEAVALPADDDLDLLPALPPDIPSSESQSTPDVVTGDRGVSNESIHVEIVSPEAIALPADDDLDLLPALPPDNPSWEHKIPENVNREILPMPGSIKGESDAVESMEREMMSPKAIALPTDDDLDLLPALPLDSPLLKPQSASNFVTEERDLSKEPVYVENVLPEAVALPADDNLDLLPALPSVSPLSKPQSTSDFVAEERGLSKESTLMEDAYPRTSLSYSSAMVSETHLPSDVTESTTPDVEISPKGEIRSIVESSEALQASAENPHEHFSHEDTAVRIAEPLVMRDLGPGTPSFEKQVDHEPSHPTEDFVEQQDPYGSRSRTPQLELIADQSSNQIIDTIDAETPTANIITDPFLSTVGEIPTPYEEPPTSMYYTPALDTEIADGYFDSIQDKEDEDVLFPTFKKGKKSKKGRQSQLATPLEEPSFAERNITSPSNEASASIPGFLSGKTSRESSSVVDEPATVGWAVSSKKKAKKGRNSQLITPLEESSSTDRSVIEPPDVAFASLEEKVLENLPQKALAVTDEPATDEWATSSKRKGKKGKKSQPITPSEALSSGQQLFVGTPIDDPTLAQESIPNVVFRESTFGDELLMEEPATTSKQRGKKRKNKNVSYEGTDSSRDDQKDVKGIADVRHFGDTDQMFFAASSESITKQADLEDQEKLSEHDDDYLTPAAAVLLATTDSAQEVTNMLGSAKKGPAIHDGQFDSRDMLRELPEPEAQTSSESIEQEEGDWGDYAKKKTKKSKKPKTSVAAVSLVTADLVENERREKDYPVATTDTAAEVRNILTSTDDVGVVTPFQEENQFSDDGFSGFTSKKKGKKNKPQKLPDPMPLNDVASITVPNLDDASSESTMREAESGNTFSMPKSKKDKKSKRKSIFRSGIDYQDASESSGMVTESAVSSAPMAGSNQDSFVDEAANVELPSQTADELLEEDVPNNDLILLPLEAPVPRFDTTSIDEASNIALPADETEDLEEREEKPVGIPHALKHDPNHNNSKFRIGSFSQSPSNEAPGSDPFMEAIRLPLPEDLQDDFIESSRLDRETASSVEKFATNVTESSDASRSQSDIKKPPQPQERGIDITSGILDAQYTVTPNAEEDVGDVDQERYNNNQMGSENYGEDERLDNVQPTLEHSRSELEKLSSVHIKAPLSLGDVESRPLEDIIEVQSTSGPFAGQSEEIATILREGINASPVSGEQNGSLVDADNFLRLGKTKKDKKKTISSTYDWNEDPSADSVEENLNEEAGQLVSAPEELQSSLPADLETMATINNEGFSASKKSKKDKKKKSSFQSWEDEPVGQVSEELHAEAPTQLVPISRDLVDARRPELEPVMTIEDDGFSVSKKSKKGKKNRKSSTLSLTREPSPLPENDRELGNTPAFDSVEAAAEEPELTSRPTADKQPIATGEGSLFDPPKRKEGKKKSKKLQTLDWADEPANIAAPQELDISTSAFNPVEAMPIVREVLPHLTVGEQMTTSNDDDLFALSNGNKSEKKSKQSQALDSLDALDEEATSPALIDPQPILPIFTTVEASFIRTGETPAITAEEQPTITSNEDDLFEPPKDKKSKNKARNLQVLDRTDEPTNVLFPATSNLQDDDTSVDVLQIPSIERTASSLPVEEPESKPFSLKKSKNDKKKGKKGTRFAWGQEPAQESGQFEDDTAAKELSGIPLDRDNVQTELEEAKPREAREDQLNNVLHSSESTIVSSTRLPGDDADEKTLLFGDKINDQEVYPNFHHEEGVIQEPHENHTLGPVGEPENTLQPRDAHVSQDVDKRQDVFLGEDPHGPGEIENSQSVSSTGFVYGQEASPEPVASSKTREVQVLEPGTANEQEALPEQEASYEPESAHDLTRVQELEPPVRRESFDMLPEPLPEPKNKQEIELERAYLPDMLEPQEDELFLQFQTKKKKKKSKGSGQATPSNFETREEPAQLVDEEPPLTLEDTGLDRTRLEIQPSQPLEKSFKEAVHEENNPNAAGTSLASKPESPTNMQGPKNTEIPIAEDEFPDFATKKKNKKGKRSRQAEDSRFKEPLTQPADSFKGEAAEPATEERNRDIDEASSYIPERIVDPFKVSTQNSSVAEDNFTGHASKKKGKKAKQYEFSVYEEPDMEKQTQEPLLAENNGDVARGLPVYSAERAEDIPLPNIQDDSIQDDDFAGFAIKKKKGKKSKPSGNLVFKEPASETAIVVPEFLAEQHEIGEGPSTYEQERNSDEVASRNQDEPAVKDDSEGFATKKGKKGKKSKKSSQARDNTFEEPPTIPAELQIPIIATEKVFPEVVDPSAETHELSSAAEGGLKPAESTLPSNEEDEWSNLGTIKRKKGKKSKKEQAVIWEDDTATNGLDKIAPYQGERTEDQAIKFSESTESSISHSKQATYEPTYLADNTQVGATPTDVSELVEPNDVSSRELRAKESVVATMEEIPKHQEIFEEPRLQSPLTRDTYQPSANSNNETAVESHMQSAQAYDNPTLDHPAVFIERGSFAPPEPSGEEQTDNFLEFPTRKKSKNSKKDRGELSFTDGSFPTSRFPASPYQLAETIEETPVLYPNVSLPESLVQGNSGQQNQLEREPRAVATEEGSLDYPRSLQSEIGIREDLSLRQTDEAGQEAAASEPNHEEVRDLPMTKKGKNGKKSKKQYLDLQPTSSTTGLQGDHSTSDKERNNTEPAVEKKSSRKNFSIIDVPLAQTQDTREHKVEQEYSMSREQENNTGPRESTNTVKPLVAATAVGAGIALFEDLARRDSISTSKKDKKRTKKSDQYPDRENEMQGEPALKQLSVLPDTAEYHESQDKSSLSEGRTRSLSPQYDPIRNRDSAIQVAESPIPGAKSSLHNSIRDSGYQGTDASPTLQEILALPRQNRFSKDSASRETEHDILSTHDYETNTIDQNHQTATQFHENSHNPLNISIEVGPAYDVSISRPVQEQEARREASQGQNRELEVELPASYSEHHEQYELINDASPVRRYDHRQPSPVDSTTRDRSSVLFQSSPSTREDSNHTRPFDLFIDDTTEHNGKLEMPQHLDEIPTSTKAPKPTEASVTREIESTNSPQSSLFGGPIGVNSDLHPIISPHGTPRSSSRRQLDSMSEYGLDDSPLQEKAKRISDRGMQEPSLRGTQRSVVPQRHSQRRVRSPLGSYTEDKELNSTNDIMSRLSGPPVHEENRSVDLDRSKSRNTDTAQRSSSRHSPLPALAIDLAKQREPDFRSMSGASIRSGESISAYIRSPDVQSPATPPLRRVDRSTSGDLRAANKRDGANTLAKAAESELGTHIQPGFASSSSYDPVRDKGKERITKMTDVYEGWGDVYNSPQSPTRPPSMRKRQSMQLLDMETRIDQLVSENRLLQDAKVRADRQLGDAVQDHSLQKTAFDDAIRTRDLYVQQKNSELNELRGILDGLQSEVSRLRELNEGLSGSTRELTSDHEQRYGQHEDDHADIHQKWQESTRELEDLRQQHASLSAGMEGIVRHEVDLALESKDVELRQMRNELETAKDQVRRLQQQILASRSSDDIIVARDEDYFDSQCQQLCQHVQQWVLRFSKFSDMKPCLSIDAVAEVRISDRFDNAILDGSDVDIYLADRIKRRDVFMSVVMTMVWEYIFQRYLFGLDREQRQKLKSLEKTLSEVGPARAVNRWRATTLTMFTRRGPFLAQRQQDTEAVVNEIFDTLAALLPPPGHLVGQITDSLRKVMAAAADLAIEMRCQLCEYLMPPPLQPEYDTHGDLARQVLFNPALMNERSGATVDNDELGARRAVVRLVLFPLVLKKGDDVGEGDEEIVVCPAQVLVARESEHRGGGGGKKTVRVVSAQSQRADAMSVGGQSVQSFAPSSMDAGMGARF